MPLASSRAASLRCAVCRSAITTPPIVKPPASLAAMRRSEEHTSELQSPCNLVCRLLLEKKKKFEQQNTKFPLSPYHIAPQQPYPKVFTSASYTRYHATASIPNYLSSSVPKALSKLSATS